MRCRRKVRQFPPVTTFTDAGCYYLQRGCSTLLPKTDARPQRNESAWPPNPAAGGTRMFVNLDRQPTRTKIFCEVGYQLTRTSKGDAMRKQNALVLFGLCTAIAGCGSSSSDSGTTPSGATGGNGAIGGNSNNGNTGGHGAIGGSGGSGNIGNTGGNGSVGGSSSSGTCNMPSCVSNLNSTCVPSGTCVEQTDQTTGATNVCYSNGIKEIATIDATTFAIDMTIKNGSAVCYSLAISLVAGSGTINDSAGNTVATISTDASGNGVITCTGGQPVTLDASCSSSSPLASPTATTSSSCTQGTCTP